MPDPITPPAPAPAPPPPNPAARFMKEWGWLIAFVVIAAQSMGYLTPEQAQTIRSVLPMSKNPEAQTTGDEAAPVLPPAPVPAPDPETVELKQLMRDLIEILKASPSPPPQPAPGPVEPTPPGPGGLRISLMDEQGKPIPSMNVEAGQLFRVCAIDATGEIGWQPVRHGAVKLVASGDGKEWFGYLESDQWVDFGLTDFGARKQINARVTCNQAPQPPPGPSPGPAPGPAPKPQPIEPPAPPQPREVSLAVVHDVKAITPEIAIVLNAADTWNSFGVDWIFYDLKDDTSEGSRAISDCNGKAPSLLIYDKKTGQLIQSQPLPKSLAALRSIVEEFK